MIPMVLFLLLFQAAPDTRFRLATEALQNQDPVTASRELAALEAEGLANGPLFVNLGIAYTQMDSLGVAKYYFTKAGRYPDVRTQTQTGMEYVNRQLMRRASGLPVLSYNRLLNRVLWDYPPRLALLIPILFLNIGAALWIWRWFSTGAWKTGAAVFCFVAAGVGFLLVAAATNFRSTYALGVIIEREGFLRGEPNAGSEPILPVYEGYDARIHVDGTADGWTKVTLINGSTGFVPSRSVRSY